MLYTGFIIFANEKNNLPVFYTTIPVRGDTNLGRENIAYSCSILGLQKENPLRMLF